MGQYGMNMYQWYHDGTDWTEYALMLGSDALNFIHGPNGSTLSELQTRSRCRVRVEPHDKESSFLVFYRGPKGHDANLYMNTALSIVSEYIRDGLRR